MIDRSENINDSVQRQSYNENNLFHSQILSNDENSLLKYCKSFKESLSVVTYVKFCSECGYNNKEQSPFCPECGNNLKLK